MRALTTLFNKDIGKDGKILLLNKEKKEVGVIYLNSVEPADLQVLKPSTPVGETYFIYYKGMGIFFSYYRKLLGGDNI